MSEITTIMTVELTLVQKMSEESADKAVKDNYNEQIQRNVADALEKTA